jgi:uncharacterized protein (TIGR00369 family)
MSTQQRERERVIRWTDPLATSQRLRALSGIDGLRAIISGAIDAPPIAHLIGFHFASVENGTVCAKLLPDESHYNPIGMVHGGVIATLLDTVVGCAVQSTLPAERAYTTLSLNVSYIRAITLATGEVTATGTIVHGGRTTAIAHGEIRDASGRLLASAETTCLIFAAPVAQCDA